LVKEFIPKGKDWKIRLFQKNLIGELGKALVLIIRNSWVKEGFHLFSQFGNWANWLFIRNWEKGIGRPFLKFGKKEGGIRIF